jgi:hypothetical protein
MFILLFVVVLVLFIVASGLLWFVFHELGNMFNR